MNTMKHFLVAACLATVSLTACSDSSTVNPGPGGWDTYWMRQAGNGNYAEITAGNMAVSKATDTTIRNFGADMVTDHTDAQNKLLTVANSTGQPLYPQLDSAHQHMMSVLSALSGRAFDSTYIYMQVKDHEAAIALMKTILQNATMPSLKTYANETLPVIQMHYDHAQHLAHTLFP